MTLPLSELIQQLDELHKKATPGDWAAHRSTDTDGNWQMGIDMPKGKNLPEYHWISTDKEPGSEWYNAELIIALRNAWPRLSAEIRRLESSAEMADLKALLLMKEEIEELEEERTRLKQANERLREAVEKHAEGGNIHHYDLLAEVLADADRIGRGE